MEIERMREVLATLAMGWTRLPDEGYNELVWCREPGYLCCPVSLWHPDRDWEQLGMVMEAMARKRFLVHAAIYTRDNGTREAAATCSRFMPGPPPQYIHTQGTSADSGSIPLVTCEAMAYALEQERPPETDEEVDDFLRAHGYDPGVVAARGREVAAAAFDAAKEVNDERI